MTLIKENSKYYMLGQTPNLELLINIKEKTNISVVDQLKAAGIRPILIVKFIDLDNKIKESENQDKE